MMDAIGIDIALLEGDVAKLADKGKTPMYIAIDNVAAGIVAVADTVKEDSYIAIQSLKAMGIEVIMLTGDNVQRKTHRPVKLEIAKNFPKTIVLGKFFAPHYMWNE